MSLIVLCIDASNLPQGANIEMMCEYRVASEFVNDFDEVAYTLFGVNNSGATKTGMRWYGYKASRFVVVDKVGKKMYDELVINN